MRLIIEPTDNHDIPSPRVEISIPGDDWDIYQVWDHLVKPALVAWSFPEALVDDLVGVGGDDDE